MELGLSVWHLDNAPFKYYTFDAGPFEQPTWRLARLNNGMPVFGFPHWFPATVSIATAALPWFRYSFSLRTLLIATTLVAVGLGLIAWAAK
jgi:hypothetical protein